MSYYKDVEKKLLKLYEQGKAHQAYITQEPFYVEINLRVPTQKDLQKDFLGYKKAIERLGGRFCVEMVEREYKLIGRQLLPKRVVYKEIEPFLKAIGKIDAFKKWQEAYKLYVQNLPKLKELFLQKPFLALENAAIAKEVVAIAHFFIQNPKPNCYIRELPILGIDTKFIEKNRRFLDQILSTVLLEKDYDATITQLGEGGFERKYALKSMPILVRFRLFGTLCGFEDLTLPIDSFAKLNPKIKSVYVIENLQTFLAFPLQEEMMVIFGKGYSAKSLQAVKWLKQKKIYYFGDIDIDGLAILSSFRSSFPNTNSFCMDLEILKKYEKLAHYIKQKTKSMPTNLTKQEQQLYHYLMQTKSGDATLRLEQERIPLQKIRKEINENI